MAKNKNKEYKNPEDEVARGTKSLGTIFMTTAAAVYIIVGAIMLFVQGVKESYLTYTVCTLIIALGIGLVVKYFVTQAYRSVNDYGFAIGIMATVFGCVGLVRSSAVTSSLPVLCGALVVVLSVVMLQQAVQLKVLNRVTWIAVLIIALVVLIAGILLVGNIGGITGLATRIEYWFMMIAGALFLICLALSAVGTTRFAKQEAEEIKKREEEARMALANPVSNQEQIEEKAESFTAAPEEVPAETPVEVIVPEETTDNME
ncbi:MAG: hypothetical protein K6E56_04215 [Lachnospiraceae bacterium]|nr:hypothetical protein [Lachnospiraceae bacterium]